MPRTPAAARPMGRTSASSEADGHARAAHHEDVVGAVGDDDPHQLVAVAQVDGDEPVAPRRVVLGERRLLHRRPCLVAKNRYRSVPNSRVSMIAWMRSSGASGSRFTIGQALGGPLPLGDLVGPQPVHLAAVGEEQQVGVGRGVDEVADRGPPRAAASRPRPAAAALRAEGVGVDRLHVAGPGHDDDELLVVDEVLGRHLARVVGELGQPRGGEVRPDLGQLVLDHLAACDPRRPGSPRARRWSARSSASSSSSSWRDSRVSWPRRMSRMWLACILAERERRRPSARRGPWPGRRCARIRAMMASIMSRARSRPSRMWARSRAFVEPELRAPGDDLDLVARCRRRASAPG